MGTYHYVPGNVLAGITSGSCHDSYSGHATTLYIARFDSSGNCIWIKTPKFNGDVGHFIQQQDLLWSSGALAIDSGKNVYLATSIYGMDNSGSNTVFGNYSVNGNSGVIAKIDIGGNWKWAEPTTYADIQSLEIDSNGDIWHSYISSGASFLEKYNSTGDLLHTYSIGSIDVWDFSIDSSGDLLLTGLFLSFTCTNNGSSQSFSQGDVSPFILKLDSQGNCLWFAETTATAANSLSLSVEVDSNRNSYITGRFYGQLTFNNNTLSTGGNQNGFVAKINHLGEWQWVNQIECSCSTDGQSVIIDNNDQPYVTGSYSGTTILGGISIQAVGGGKDVFLVKMNQNGTSMWKITGGSNGHDKGFDIASSSSNLYLFGTMGNAITFSTLVANKLSTSSNYDTFLVSLSKDYDSDGIPDSNDFDDDDDFINDPVDSCRHSPIGFKSTSNYDHDSDGCHDDLEDDDDDNDQLNDTLDNCPKGMTGWSSSNLTDLDSDGCMDALEDYDDDADGYEDYEDYCQRVPGNSTMEFEKGCPDTDGDSRPDILDPFPNNASEWQDRDGDEVGDNSDAFPLDATQQSDTDGDTYGDEEFGNAGDSCPGVFGNSTIDRYGCLDTDGDGWSDAGDDFPNDPDEYLDTDGDLVPDHLDEFPFDPTQQTDSDGDGYGDNANGNLGDVFPNDATRYADSDRDGVDDASDAFPYDPTQTEDGDGDGMGDNPMGIGADKFPDDATQWGDIDGDGFGDNPSGTNPDAFITDATQWSDEDGDGYGDNPAGRLYDQFPQNPTQWLDEDGDGLGDNLSGTDADPSLNDFDNDGYNDSIDPLPKLPSPGDLDNDGVLDVNDLFPDDSREWADYDGDGEGDNADADDDNDGWADTDEVRLGTDPYGAADVPIDSFEIVIPGTAVGLGAWDLIGMFGGIPLFVWIGFGFVTRNGRTAKYEGLLREAQTRDELEDVARMWEYSLMLRMLGPHQGIRLERLRAELDDVFEGQNQKLSSIEPQQHDQTQMVEQAMQVEQKSLPSIEFTQPDITVEGNPDGKGYEWYTDGQETSWYRNEDSNSEWQRFEA